MSSQNREKVTEAFLKVDADAADADDDGRVGICKVPLPGGTVELISVNLAHALSHKPSKRCWNSSALEEY